MTIVLARAADCQIERRIETVRGRVRSVAASSSVLLGAGAENVSTWATGDFRVSHVVRAHPKQVTALVALPDGGWASGGTDGDLATGSHGGSRRLGQLADLPDRILALPGGTELDPGNSSRRAPTSMQLPSVREHRRSSSVASPGCTSSSCPAEPRPR